MFGWFSDPYISPSWRTLGGGNRLLSLIRAMDEQEERLREAEEKHQSFSSEQTIVSRNGEQYEEHRERVCDVEGTTHEATTRRIGDKWVRIEEETKPDGKKHTKEVWHNVSSEETDAFKKKWEEKRGKFGFEHLSLPHNPKAVKHQEVKA